MQSPAHRIVTVNMTAVAAIAAGGGPINPLSSARMRTITGGSSLTRTSTTIIATFGLRSAAAGRKALSHGAMRIAISGDCSEYGNVPTGSSGPVDLTLKTSKLN